MFNSIGNYNPCVAMHMLPTCAGTFFSIINHYSLALSPPYAALLDDFFTYLVMCVKGPGIKMLPSHWSVDVSHGGCHPSGQHHDALA
jgi:hypothetical protein